MNIVTDIFLPLILAFMMFTLGLDLKLSDFSRLLKRPRDMTVGLGLQLIALPLVGYFLASFWSTSPEIAMGLMLIAIAPGGVTSNYLTALARGDVALSISLTATTSILAPLTIPIVLSLSYQTITGEQFNSEFSLLYVTISAFLIVTVPVFLGMTVRHFAVNFADAAKNPLHKLSSLFFLLVLAGAIAKERDNIAAYFAEAGLITLALNLIMMTLAFSCARLLGSGRKQEVSLAIECGLQNGTLAIALGALLFEDGRYLIPAATYSLIMFASALAFIAITRRQDQQQDNLSGL
ncbi:bile acid:sodium symporter family protein [Kiloniella sp. b19]|uniref:bile acid:sodium symporter family protein n=1 Tax=Kiloniella sp. GXU_MW_B19 TaxID=3141326 RepID=UPI0031DB30C0